MSEKEKAATSGVERWALIIELEDALRRTGADDETVERIITPLVAWAKEAAS